MYVSDIKALFSQVFTFKDIGNDIIPDSWTPTYDSISFRYSTFPCIKLIRVSQISLCKK